MRIVPFKSAASLAELATQMYNLPPGSPLAATAEKALLAANPQLADNIAEIAAGTPIVAPAVAGTTLAANDADPRRQTLMGVLARLQQSATQASNAQLTGSGSVAPTKTSAARTAALETLAADIRLFSSVAPASGA